MYLTNRTPAITPPPPPIDARIVELPSARSATGSAAKPQTIKHMPHRISKTIPVSSSKPVQSKPAPANDIMPHAAAKPALDTAPTPAPAHVAPPAKNTEPPPPAAPLPSPGDTSDSTKAGTQAMGAHAIYQPQPMLPEDLRNETMHLVIVARFQIAEDGSVTVKLIKSAPDPRVNQLILNTLKTWRFFPATQADKPVASTEDINISIDVGD